MKVNDNGYWENMTINDIKAEHAFDSKLCSSIKEFFINENAKTLVDLGCGLGNYTKELNNEVTQCDGFDGNPNTPELTNNICKVLDLSIPQTFNAPYDWVMSLEVGEHIPKIHEQTFINNICGAAKNGILMSWAVKGQGGKGHFNEQNNDYIIDLLQKNGFQYDLNVSRHLRNNCTLWWFKKTMMVFRKV
jgi:cyclopropane fatty-acyl-phospholipid synthase-like methyltransferase